MRKLWNGLKEFYRHGDLLLLLFCVIASLFGLLIIASTTRFSGSSRFLVVQGAALILGVMLYIAVSLLDIEIVAEHWLLLWLFNTLFMLLLLRWGI